MPSTTRTSHNVGGYKITILTGNGLSVCFATVGQTTFTAARRWDAWTTQGAIVGDGAGNEMDHLPEVPPDVLAAFEQALTEEDSSRAYAS